MDERAKAVDASFASASKLSLTARTTYQTQHACGCYQVCAFWTFLGTCGAYRWECPDICYQYQPTTLSTTPAGATVTGGNPSGTTVYAYFTSGETVMISGGEGVSIAWTGCSSVDAQNRCFVQMNAAMQVTGTRYR